jgi:hypothetical protein
MSDSRLSIKTSIAAKRLAGVRVSKRQPFRNHTGTFRGVVGFPGSLGELPTYWRNRFPARGVVYTIMSYDTPIAWLDHNDEWTVPDVRYSPTTTFHQGVVRSYLLVGEKVAA